MESSTREPTRGANARGVPEAKLDAATLASMHEMVSDPDVAWRLITERTERWRREQALTVDARKGLMADEKKLEKKIARLVAAIEDGQPVGNALKERQAELDALRVRLAEPEPLDVDADAFEKALMKNTEWLKWRGPVIKTNDTAQTRAAMRTLGVDRITVTPTETGWTFEGNGNLAGLISGGSGKGAARRSPRMPPTGHPVRLL